jgi:phosphoesterase RecJ-like protein
MTVQEFAAQLQSFIDRHDRIILSGHIRPDGDSIGSCVALGLELERQGKHPMIYYEGDISRYGWVNQTLPVLDENGLCKATRGRFGWIMLDCAEPARTGEAAVCADLAEETLCIDHHVIKGEFANFNWIRSEATYTSEVLYELFKVMEYPISKEVAVALFTGIAFDTGGFRHSSMTPQVFHMAGELAETGLDITEIMNGLFHTKKFIEEKVMSVILRKAKMYHGKIILSAMEGKDFLSVGAGSDDCEGAVAQLAEVEEAEAAVFLRELQPGLVRVNLRSKHFVDVAKVARTFGGGGHVRAAGCTIAEPMLLVQQMILAELKKQLPEEI